MKENFRAVNRTVGMTPKFGSFSLYQILPLFAIAGIVYYLKEMMGFSWIVAVIIFGACGGLVLAVLGDKPWLFFGLLMKPPHIVRAGAWYQPLLSEEHRRYVNR